MKPYLPLLIVLTLLAFVLCATAQTTSPDELVSANVTINKKTVFLNKTFPKSLAKGVAFMGRDNMISLSQNGIVLPDCATVCQAYMQRDVRRQTSNTNKVWFPTVMSQGEAVMKSESVLIWVEPKDFLKAYREVSARGQGNGGGPPRPPLNPSNPNSNPPIRSDECKCEKEVCISQNGTASFSFKCDGVGFMVSTKGEFSLSFGGNKASGEVVVIGSKD